jgi:hypothetical protein
MNNGQKMKIYCLAASLFYTQIIQNLLFLCKNIKIYMVNLQFIILFNVSYFPYQYSKFGNIAMVATSRQHTYACNTSFSSLDKSGVVVPKI